MGPPVSSPIYFMESAEESLRLDLKTDPIVVEEQARWAGAAPGMRVADVGCGAGKTTGILHRLVEPGGQVVGIDYCQERVDYAVAHYAAQGIAYLCRDARDALSDLGQFDLVWIRFLLEYYELHASDIAKQAYQLLEPGGTLCLIDLDQNCLGCFGASPRLDRTMRNLVLVTQRQYGFDPFAGRKLYAYLYDLGCLDIEVKMTAHHLTHGELSEIDRFNWLAKAEAVRKAPQLLADDYPGGYQEFRQELIDFLEDPRRFIYTPLIMCKGKKPGPRG